MARIAVPGVVIVVGLLGMGALVAATSISVRQAMSKGDGVVAGAQAGRPSASCEAYNYDLAAAAAQQTRLQRHEEAARLLSLRQRCDIQGMRAAR